MTEIIIERSGYDIEAAFKNAKKSPEYHQEAILLDVARRISDAMDEQGVTRADLARKLNVSQPYITKVLRGTENFSLKTLARIAFVLKKKWEVFLVNSRAGAVSYDRAEKDSCFQHARVAEKANTPAYNVRTTKRAKQGSGKT